jgi:hypothetical protein
MGAVLGEYGGTGLADAGTRAGDDDDGIGDLHGGSFRVTRADLVIVDYL